MARPIHFNAAVIGLVWSCFVLAGSGATAEARVPFGSGICTGIFENDGDSSPAFSPDGSRVAFTRDLLTDPAIMVWNMRTHRLRRVAAGQRPSWSPDGKSLVFNRTITPAGPGGGTCIYKEDDLFVVDLRSGATPVQVTDTPDRSESSPSWGRNGRITYAFNGGLAIGGGIASVNRRGSNLRILVSASGSDYVYFASPSWSRDGKRLVYAAGWDLFVSGGTRVRPKRVTSGIQERSYMEPAWSPGGGRIAFTQVEGFTTSVHLMRSDGRGVHRLADGLEPVWSPITQSIVFVTERRVSHPSGPTTEDCLYQLRIDRTAIPRPLLPQSKQPADCRVS